MDNEIIEEQKPAKKTTKEKDLIVNDNVRLAKYKGQYLGNCTKDELCEIIVELSK